MTENEIVKRAGTCKVFMRRVIADFYYSKDGPGVIVRAQWLRGRRGSKMEELTRARHLGIDFKTAVQLINKPVA